MRIEEAVAILRRRAEFLEQRAEDNPRNRVSFDRAEAAAIRAVLRAVLRVAEDGA